MKRTYFETIPLETIKTIVEVQITEKPSENPVSANLGGKKAVGSGRKANWYSGEKR